MRSSAHLILLRINKLIVIPNDEDVETPFELLSNEQQLQTEAACLDLSYPNQERYVDLESKRISPKIIQCRADNIRMQTYLENDNRLPYTDF